MSLQARVAVALVRIPIIFHTCTTTSVSKVLHTKSCCHPYSYPVRLSSGHNKGIVMNFCTRTAEKLTRIQTATCNMICVFNYVNAAVGKGGWYISGLLVCHTIPSALQRILGCLFKRVVNSCMQRTFKICWSSHLPSEHTTLPWKGVGGWRWNLPYRVLAIAADLN